MMANTDVEKQELTKDEQERLKDLETTIERGQLAFMDVGKALTEIRASKLYRDPHKTFEAYCRDRWDFTDRRARQLMDAVVIVDELEKAQKTGTVVPVLPTAETQVRELASAPADKRVAVWKAALARAKKAGRRVTTDDVWQSRYKLCLSDETEKAAAAAAAARNGNAAPSKSEWTVPIELVRHCINDLREKVTTVEELEEADHEWREQVAVLRAELTPTALPKDEEHAKIRADQQPAVAGGVK